MGQSQSREQRLLYAAKRGDIRSIKELTGRGVDINCTDAKGRTPLMLACSRPEAWEAAKALLELGSDVGAVRKAPHGGTALHHATRKLLERTVLLLMDRGADPLLPNASGRTPLDIARERGAVAIVRLIEGRLALFTGYVRQQQLSAPALLKAIIPQWVFKKVWVAVLPGTLEPNNTRAYSLTVYLSMASTHPSASLSLPSCLISLSKLNSPNPVLLLEDRGSDARWKFTGDRYSCDPSQIRRLHDVCQRVAQPVPGAACFPHGPPRFSSHHNPHQTQQLQIPSPSFVPPPPPLYSLQPHASDPYYHWQQQQQQQQQHQQQHQQQQQHHHPSGSAYELQSDLDEETAFQLALCESVRTAEEEGEVMAMMMKRSDSERNGQLWGGSGLGYSTNRGGSSLFCAPPAAAAAGPSSRNEPFRSASYSASGQATLPRARASRSADTPSTSTVAPLPPSAPPVSFVYDSRQTASAVTAPAGSIAPSDGDAPPRNPSRQGNAPTYSVPCTPTAAAAAAAPAGSLATAGPVTMAPATPASAELGTEELHPRYNPARVHAEIKNAEMTSGKGSGRQCVICWDVVAEAACVPCGHVAGCLDCLVEVKAKGWGCPVCRAEIREIVKIFHV